MPSSANREAYLDLTWHDKQKLLRDSPATEIAYGGAAGGGKSYGLRGVGLRSCGAIPGLQVYLFRKHHEELVTTHVDTDKGFRELLSGWIAAGKAIIVKDQIRFWNGARIHLCHCQHRKDLDKFLSAEMHLLMIDQAEQFPEPWLRFLRTRVRMSEGAKSKVPQEWQGRFPRIVYSFNPGGASHSYFRNQFVKIRPELEIWKTPEAEGGFYRQFIKARLVDNPSLNYDEYRSTLLGLNDEILIRAYLEGDMDIQIGNFFQEYREDRHVTPDFAPPKHWYKFLTFDWGSAEPFVVYWWCVSDGEQFVDGRGRKRWFPRGSLVGYREWYGCNPRRPSQGIRFSNEQIAQGIKERGLDETSGMVVTDSLPFQDRGGWTPAMVFRQCGVPLVQGDTTRIGGWSQLRSRLIGTEGYPTLYLTESCVYARDYLPAIERHPTRIEDAVEHGEATHACDAIRLACMCFPVISDRPIETGYYGPVDHPQPTMGEFIELARKSQQSKNGRTRRKIR